MRLCFINVSRCIRIHSIQSTIEPSMGKNNEYHCEGGNVTLRSINTNYTAGVGARSGNTKIIEQSLFINGKRCWHSFNLTLMRLKLGIWRPVYCLKP